MPSYRGAAPIQRALIDGRKTSGISIIDVAAEGFDVGHVLLQEELLVDDDIKYTALAEEMGRAGADALVRVLEDFENVNARKVSQDQLKADNLPSAAPKIQQKVM